MILIIALSSFIGRMYGQLKPEDVFITGEHFNQKECLVETYPDWGSLIILDNDRFFSMNLNKSKHIRDTLGLVGNYRIYNDTLHLTSIKWAVAISKWASKDTIDFDTPDYKWMKRSYPDIKFKISKCEDGQLLLVCFTDNRFWYSRKDPTGYNRIKRMKDNGVWEYLLR